MFFFFDEESTSDCGNLPTLVDSTSTDSLPPHFSKYLRIHGDNIVECERTLELIKNAYQGELTLLRSPLYKPRYALSVNEQFYVLELLSGHGRWGVDVTSVLQNNGGILHEGADSYVTEVIDEMEHLVFALEYCSALPAGNNAWQRSGRAISSVFAGVPYLYYAEIGGVELDDDREVKAPRFPNPVVPYSYLSTSKDYDAICVPVYKTHPSITNALYQKFKNTVGLDEGLEIIKGLIEKENIDDPFNRLVQKDLQLVKLLAADRKSIDTLRGQQWDRILQAESPAQWLVDNTPGLTWRKKSSDKVRVSDTFRQLISFVINCNCKTIGSKELPVCLVPINKISSIETKLKDLYPDLPITIRKDKPLAIVWITGFKPRGDDSRPDRGLAPLAKMAIGNSAYLMAVVSGPAKQSTWDKMDNSVDQLRNDNGLWQALFNLCDYVLADSATIAHPRFFHNAQSMERNTSVVSFPKAGDPISFSEYDTDCAIHQIFAHKNHLGILECMCNPPGGDWSGVSCFSKTGEYRWTSLPRVSHIGGKRPDHVIQIAHPEDNVFLAIESKGKGADLEDNIGIHLNDYMCNLFNNIPTAYRSISGDWRAYGESTPVFEPHRHVSIGAFLYKNDEELSTHLDRGNLDAIMAFELAEITIVHVLDSTQDSIVIKALSKAESLMTGFKIQIH